MFRVTVDLFSGRPNPSWIVVDEAITSGLLDALRDRPDLYATPGSGFTGLGYRGVHVEFFGDDHRVDSSIPDRISLADGAPERNLQEAAALIRPLLEAMSEHARIALPEHQLTPIDPATRATVLDWFDRFVAEPPKVVAFKTRSGTAIRRTVRDRSCEGRCEYEISRFNPAFWNTDPNVRLHNNCYNYGRNWRTNTFAQPGRASGFPLGPGFTGADVVQSAMHDGLKRRCDCLPPSEYPRRLMALVYAPHFTPGGSPDYHWYREQIGGFWGHKPGGTAARNFDNSNHLVTNPETADRGPYTEFHGYFYAGKSVIIV
jgi:hypothetical protein